jgi:indolepyruvate ferredoxin oxidoreductase
LARKTFPEPGKLEMEARENTSTVELDDRYSLATGKAYMSGTQTLLRLLLEQARRDRAAGLTTAGFVSGYRGSPLGGFDLALWKAQKFLDEEKIHFQPGLNEDLAVTSVWGSQQTDIFGSKKYDGVFGMWYGKLPGLDRSGDAFKHAHISGTSRYGGVLAVSGDDPAMSSTSAPGQSEHTFASYMMPVIYPATLQEILTMGLKAYGLSRYSGNWIGFKTVSDIAETSASVEVTSLPAFQLPDNHGDMWEQVIGRWPDDRFSQDARVQEVRLPAVGAFARINRFDEVMINPPKARFGIVAAGKPYLDLRQALDDLGITDVVAAQIGLSVFKLGLIWPIERDGMTDFAKGLDEILVVEERRPFIETQIKELAYNWDSAARPAITGKTNENGQPLIPSTGVTSAALLAEIIGRRLVKLTDHPAIKKGLAEVEARKLGSSVIPSPEFRVPHFCPGCPHNRGTSTPEGSASMAGIGCHSLAMWMPGNETVTFTHMGAEGANWIGAAAFVDQNHMFQNLGDGTYAHSGSLAIRAAKAAGCNITYKILFNDAVAMTGGQPVEGHASVLEIACQLKAEGIKKIVVVADDPKKYDDYGPDFKFPSDIVVYPREEMTTVMKDCREWPGISILIYDQVCATERRRRRKRGIVPPATKRVVINERVCEGCGDCSVQSKCVAIRPLDTPLGIKRQIDQSGCNQDLLCLEGFCPAMVTVEGGTLRKPILATDNSAKDIPLPDPTLPSLNAPYDILIAGVGGTGLITIGSLLGMAAHLEGKECSVLDNTGIARMGGGVTTHVRLGAAGTSLNAARIENVNTNVLIGGDPVVAASAEVLSRLALNQTKAVVNSYIAPTAAQAENPELGVDVDGLLSTLKNRIGEGQAQISNATELAGKLMGNKIFANIILLGLAYQKGLIPLEAKSLHQAITLNASAIDDNLKAFDWGRRLAIDAIAVAEFAGLTKAIEPTLDQRIADHARDLEAYQNAAYAKRYTDFIATIHTQEHEKIGNSDRLTAVIADNYYKLLAGKDEYEVARLYSDGQFEQTISEMFEGDFKLEYHVGRNLLTPEDPNADHLKKRKFGPWFKSALCMLNSAKGIRGTVLDPFRYTADRRRDRKLLSDYEQTIQKIMSNLSAKTLDLTSEIAALPSDIRGFGVVKDRSILATKKREDTLLAQLD